MPLTLLEKAIENSAQNGHENASKIKEIVQDYNKHAFDVIPTTVATVGIWMAAQMLIEEFIKAYTPGVQRWQLAVIEIFVASFFLYWFSRQKK